MALRNNPRIGAHTREKIKAMAQKLGYRPDPRLCALAAYRTRNRRLHQREVIVYLMIIQPEVHPIDAAIGEGIRERSEELGYIFEINKVERTAAELKKVARSFKARGIRGVILNAGRAHVESLPFPWEDFQAVQVSGHPNCRFLPSLTADYYKNTELAVTKVAALGYKRPGLWQHWITSETVEQYLVGGFRQGCLNAWGTDDYPVFRAPEIMAPLAPQVIKWARKHELDVVFDTGMGRVFTEIVTAEGKDKWQCGFVALDVYAVDYPSVAGIVQPRKLIGRSAVDQLHALLMINHSGLVTHPPALHFMGEWRDGQSLPRHRRRREADSSIQSRVP